VLAIIPSGAGGPEVLRLTEIPDPTPGPGDVLIATAATAVNRADLLQRQGLYAPPPGASDVIGLECSGTVLAVGEDVTTVSPGDEVCALLAGGGYATRIVVPAGQVMPIPAGMDLIDAASLPEAVCTVWSNLFMIASVQPEETVLIHGGSGGVGTIAIQLAKQVGARVLTTASAAKAELCRSLGADVVIDYAGEDFVARSREVTEGHGVDVILDNMGAKYLSRNIESLAPGGRLVVIGLQGGARTEIDLSALMGKRAAVIGSLLRPRPIEEKAAICGAVVEHVWPLVAEGKVRPVISEKVPLANAAEAHRLLESGASVGKILLTA
jgi:putative PIG3 family NAD(P)H quinone oxidoreductase